MFFRMNLDADALRLRKHFIRLAVGFRPARIDDDVLLDAGSFGAHTGRFDVSCDGIGFEAGQQRQQR